MVMKPSEAELSLFREMVSREDDIHLSLTKEAKELQQDSQTQTNMMLKKESFAGRIVLVSRPEPRKVGPKLVWVTFQKAKSERLNKSKIRFTREIGGRRGGRYPKTIFSVVPTLYRPAFYDLEDRAYELRMRISFWRATLREAKLAIQAHEGQE